MEGITEIRDRHRELRDAITTWIRTHHGGEAWYYQPTPVSNPAAWIVPHLLAFEQEFVYDKVAGYSFSVGAPQEIVEKYKPGTSGYLMKKSELMSVEEAVAGLARMREISDRFFAEVLTGGAGTAKIDQRQVVELYQFNSNHDQEHLGQLKYLAGTWDRLNT